MSPFLLVPESGYPALEIAEIFSLPLSSYAISVPGFAYITAFVDIFRSAADR